MGRERVLGMLWGRFWLGKAEGGSGAAGVGALRHGSSNHKIYENKLLCCFMAKLEKIEERIIKILKKNRVGRDGIFSGELGL